MGIITKWRQRRAVEDRIWNRNQQQQPQQPQDGTMGSSSSIDEKDVSGRSSDDDDDNKILSDNDLTVATTETTTTTTTTATTSERLSTTDRTDNAPLHIEEMSSQSSLDDDVVVVCTATSTPLSTTGPSSSSSSSSLNNESIYDYYIEQLFPAIQASLPILMERLGHDMYATLQIVLRRVLYFLLPWLADNDTTTTVTSNNNNNNNQLAASLEWSQAVASRLAANITMLWEQAIQAATATTTAATTTATTTTASINATTSTAVNSLHDFLLRHFDSNHDGHVSPAELLNFTEHMVTKVIQQAMPPPPSYFATTTTTTTSISSSYSAFWTWFSREWPLMDWKVGVFVWRSCGGLLLLIGILTIIPGRLHGISGRLLRWPILALVYFLINVELLVYVVIRIFIRIAELLIAHPKHRMLRNALRSSTSYQEWYQYAQQLDQSQKRQRQQPENNNTTTTTSSSSSPYSSYRYNWSLIHELVLDMRTARHNNDALLAMAVLQQCTRKNVGGIMSEELFSFTNTGEPSHQPLVAEFIQEVVTTLHWITDAVGTNPSSSGTSSNGTMTNTRAAGGGGVKSTNTTTPQVVYEEHLQRKVKTEKDKIWRSLVTWATLNFQDSSKDSSKDSNNNKNDNNTKTLDCDPGAAAATSTSTSSQQVPISVHRETVLTLLKRARAAYGRTALCLSGGAMMGNYHWGHVKALLEEGILPHIISGTSAGSVVGAILCTRTDEELMRDLQPEVLVDKLVCFSRPWMERIKSVAKNGHMFDIHEWLELIQWFTCGDLTFEEAYRKTGRVFCITLSATTKKSPPVLLNYISAPNVTIASAVVASAAVPGFVPPVSLQYKHANGDGVVEVRGRGKNVETYFDGSIEQDIPTSGLAEMLNVQFFIACQCNPHIVPFFYNSKGGVGRPTRWSSGQQEYCWRGGFLLAALEMYLKNDMKAKFVFLNDLEAAVGFTSTMMTQEFGGSTTIVPEVSFFDYFKLFSNPSLKDLKRYFQVGSVSVYPHCAMIKLHYSIADALDECLAKLDNRTKTRPRTRGLGHHNEGHDSLLRNVSPTNSTSSSSSSLQHPSNPSSPTARKPTNEAYPQSSETSVSEEDEYERNWIYDI